MKLESIQKRLKDVAEQRLPQCQCVDPKLYDAMHYGLMNGGKRIRPFLVYATAQALASHDNEVLLLADGAALSIEMIHSYSLVHDDLPAMDDDDLRRGKPTCHIAFDEATAILAGDALLTGAFEIVATDTLLDPLQRLKIITLLSQYSGCAGMVGGQSIDLSHVGKVMELAQLETMHRHKTGALIKAAVMMGATCAGVEIAEKYQAALLTYADAIGLAFQVQDDILDIEGDTAVLGKQQGADIALNKPTYPALLGLEGARAKAQLLVKGALNALAQLPGNTETLAALANYIIERDH
ncbi:MAG: (2E,6E)-farnesyl diphosphate synthase [Oleibacter sp.]|nr:(2E,6E)-farnesyl diphosphate synthase [Thalassolituus sp.]